MNEADLILALTTGEGLKMGMGMGKEMSKEKVKWGMDTEATFMNRISRMVLFGYRIGRFKFCKLSVREFLGELDAFWLGFFGLMI